MKASLTSGPPGAYLVGDRGAASAMPGGAGTATSPVMREDYPMPVGRARQARAADC
jgi:hypothetical protein